MTHKKDLEHEKALHDIAVKSKKKDAKYKALLSQNLRLQKEVDAALSIVQSTKTHTIKQKTGGGESEAVAVAVASDWHVEEEVRAATVNGMNKFNLDIAKKRANRFFERVVRMVRKEQQDVAIKHLVLILGGDFVTGRIHEENLETCLLRPIDAIIYAQELIESGIWFLLDNTSLDITVPCVVGN